MQDDDSEGGSDQQFQHQQQRTPPVTSCLAASSQPTTQPLKKQRGWPELPRGVADAELQRAAAGADVAARAHKRRVRAPHESSVKEAGAVQARGQPVQARGQPARPARQTASCSSSVPSSQAKLMTLGSVSSSQQQQPQLQQQPSRTLPPLLLARQNGAIHADSARRARPFCRYLQHCSPASGASLFCSPSQVAPQPLHHEA